MILIDTSAWVEFIHGKRRDLCDKVDRALATEIVVIGDLVYCELMQGIHDPRERANIGDMLLSLPQFDMVGFDIAEKASSNYRRLRERGITIRKTIDVIIGTFCAEHDIALIHNDKDFERMKDVVPLRTV